jgi:S-adenosylmethionine-dependent methyltransferase
MNPVVSYYTANAEGEWQRQAWDGYHRLEFLVTHHLLARYLPANSLVLDAGGGPGRHALELCRRGHRVVLCDITPALLEMAKTQARSEPPEVQSRLLDAVVADVRDLSQFAEASFDAALCTGGPVSHIPDPEGRTRAVRELVRVTRPGGVVCLGVNGYLALLRTVMRGLSDLLVDEAWLTRFVRDGNSPRARMEWHFFRADEVRELAESCGLTTLAVAGCEGLSSGLPEATNALAEDPTKWATWCEMVLATACEPAVADLSEHILYFGRR